MTQLLRRMFFEKGYVVLNAFFSKPRMDSLVQRVRKNLMVCAQELSCPYEDYLKVASRWVSPSPVTRELESYGEERLRSFLSTFLENPERTKLNIISKTPYAPLSTPFHQDISYSSDSPYELSVWVAMTDAPSGSGPLAVLEGSHTAIEPAVDFWSLGFVQEDFSKKEHFRELSVQKGDLVVFDSRLWHGSGIHQTNEERFAFVTRWKSKDYDPPRIPPIVPKPFGMWTCKIQTEKVLSKGLKIFFKDTAEDYASLLKRWIQLLQKGKVPFLTNQFKAIESLQAVFLLHQAYEKHNAGDCTGTIYRNLWHSVLRPTLQHMKNERLGE